MTLRELWHTDPTTSEIRIRSLNSFTGEDILVQSEYSLISNGTEKIICSGMVPNDITEQMKVQGMEGDFTFPVKYGYSVVGKVIHGPARIIHKRIHLMHPHQDYIFLNNYKFTIIPNSIPAKRAVFAPIMETALTILWDSEISVGDTVLVCGFGLVGTFVASLLMQMPSVNTVVWDIDGSKREFASSLGFTLLSSSTAPSAGFDCAVNTSASSDGLQRCLDLTADDSIIVEASWYGSREVNLNLGDSFHPGRKKIVSSQVSRIPLNRALRFDNERRMQTVFNLLDNPFYNRLPLNEISFEDAPEVFGRLRRSAYDNQFTIIRYQK